MKKLCICLMMCTAAWMFSGCETDNDSNTPVTGVSLNKSYFAVSVWDTEQLVAEVSPANASDKRVAWSSSDPDCARVDENGLVTGGDYGTVRITVTTTDGSFTDYCDVTVVYGTVNPVQGVSITGGRGVVIGSGLSLSAGLTPSNASIKNVTWSSSDESKATVAPNPNNGLNGVVTGVAEGTVTITVTTVDGGHIAAHEVSVFATALAVIRVSLNQTTAALTVPDTLQLIAAIEPAAATNPSITWSSSFPSIASVNNNGLVTAVANGTADITVTTADGGFTATCTVTVTGGEDPRNFTEIEGDTLVHYYPPLSGVNHFGSDLGANNPDGSYTFNGTAGSWSGGGAQYNFPAPNTGDPWALSDYDLVEMHLIVTDGSVTVGVKKYGNNIDLKPYPDASNSVTFNTTTNAGKFTYTAVIEEAGAGIGFQRNTGGPAVVGIEKVIFSRGAIRTISFTGGEYAAMTPIDPIKIPDGRTVNFGSSYTMPERPAWAGHTFIKWKNTTDDVDFNEAAAITKDLTLTAQWEEGEPQEVDMRLDLNPANWGALPPVPGLTGGSPSFTIPNYYAEAAYDDAAGVLTLSFDGMNRQRAIIPLSEKQIDELTPSSVPGATFKIVGEILNEDGTASSAKFRLHLGDATATSAWNGTTTGSEAALRDHLVEYRSFDSSNKRRATLGWFIIQAMYKESETGGGQPGPYDKVIMKITSITVEPGNTQ